MSDLDHQIQILKFVREAIDEAFSDSSQEVKAMALEAFLKIQEIEKLYKTGQIVKVTSVLESLALAISKSEELANVEEHENV